MALGTNYKRTGDREQQNTYKRLAAHDKRMKELMAEGHSKEDASKMAFKEIVDGTLKY